MTHEATASVHVTASPERVWEALTDPALVKQYFFGTEVESDWRPGSPITYRGEWEGTPYEDKGVVQEVEHPHRLVTTFYSAMSGLPDVPENYQKVTYELVPDDAGTTVTVTQDNNASEEAAAQSSANWGMVLEGLAKVLE